MLTHISVRGAREHNLKGVDIDIPRETLTVITGLSGSGKSSLAFDTIYAEGRLERSGNLSVIKARRESQVVTLGVADGVQTVRIEIG